MALTKVSYSMIDGAPAVNIVDVGGEAGPNDNTAAMNAAADALNAIGGGVILIPYAGEWRMNWVCLYNNITVQGVGGSGEFNVNCIRPFVITSAAITFGDGNTIVRYCGLNDVHISGIAVAGGAAAGITQVAFNAPHALLLRGGTVNFTANRVVVYNGRRSVSLEPSTTLPVTATRFNNGQIRNDLTDATGARCIFQEYVSVDGYATDNKFFQTKLNGPTLGYAAVAVDSLLEVESSYWDVKPGKGILLSGSAGLVCHNLQLDPGTNNAIVIAWDNSQTNPARFIRGILRHGGQLWENSTGTGSLPDESDTYGYKSLFKDTWLSNATYFTNDSSAVDTAVSVARGFGGGVNALTLTGAAFVPQADDAFPLGIASNRWSVVYAATGTINTSDARQKQDIELLSEAEKRVAVAIKGLIKKFRFKSAVESKGEKARIHVGVMAQEVKAAFETEGLDGFKYAILCYDEWEDQDDIVNGDGEIIGVGAKAGNRYGIRYEELLAFIIAAM
jgi:hypothetical protein